MLDLFGICLQWLSEKYYKLKSVTQTSTMADAAGGKPKLVYFDLQGRAQAIRYLFALKGIEYEDVRVSFEDWPAIKAAGTYTAVGGSLPSLVEADGSKKNQGMAILHGLCKQHGVVPASCCQTFEMHWFFQT